MKSKKKSSVSEFYKVAYYLEDRLKWACYFSLESAQEAMVKMIHMGIKVSGMESQKL